MTKRFELVDAERKTPPAPQPCNDIVAYPPLGLGINVLETANGPIVAEMINGRLGFRLRSLAQLPRSNGLLWERASALIAQSTR
jgi:hypothetical protein